MKLIDKDALVAEIEKLRQLIRPRNTGEMKVADVPKPFEQGWLNALKWVEDLINSTSEESSNVCGDCFRWLQYKGCTKHNGKRINEPACEDFESKNYELK